MHMGSMTMPQRFYVTPLAMVLVFSFCSFSYASNAKEQTSMNTNPVESALVNVQDAQIISAGSDERRAEIIYAAIRDLEVDGIYLRAPVHVDAAKTGSWPVMIIVGQSGERARSRDLSKNALLLVMPLDRSGPLLSAEIYPEPANKIPMPRKKGIPLDVLADVQQPTRITSAVTFDLSTLRDSLTPGRYAIVATAYDWRSNVVVVEITHSAAHAPAPALAPPTGLTSELNLSSAPSKKFADGVTLDPPVGWAAGATSLPLEGSVGVRINAQWLQNTAMDVRAHIPVHLVLVEQNVLRLTAVDLTLVAHRDPALKADDKIEGSFHIDLRKSIPRLSSTTQMAYIFVGTTASGPFRVAVSK